MKLSKISSGSLDTVRSARNIGFTFDEHRSISFSDHISALSKSCYSHIHQLCSIRACWSQNSQYNRHLHRALQAGLLQLTLLGNPGQDDECPVVHVHELIWLIDTDRSLLLFAHLGTMTSFSVSARLLVWRCCLICKHVFISCDNFGTDSYTQQMNKFLFAHFQLN